MKTPKEIEDKLALVERQIRGMPVPELMEQIGFGTASTDSGKQGYFKRFGDVGILITTDGNPLPATWDESTNLAFMEFWSTGEMQFIHEHDEKHHFAITDKLVEQTMFSLAFYDENEILKWLKHHAPDVNNLKVKP